MNDFDRIAMFVDMQNALARLTLEVLAALDAEVSWVEEQKAAGRVPSPETLLAHAPLYMRVMAGLGDAY